VITGNLNTFDLETGKYENYRKINLPKSISREEKSEEVAQAILRDSTQVLFM
jgi:hypothetical protein